MKKTIFMSLALLASLTFVGCKSSESNYKKAYDKAKAQELADQKAVAATQASETTVKPVQQTQPVVQDNSDLRSERLNVLNNGTLKAFNVVCGSFKSLDNANNLRNTLVSKGFTAAQVAQNPETSMYRVVASSFDDRASAINSRNDLRKTYPDAWILLRQY